ncbi:hypothetical protein TOPH_00240 [Tolypocladium ophioglossoides CBS 100239]|uniref:N-acetylgalactosaminide beta-1,3-galactosyltransferase n=1 Tax=Tolypocladium ophioglossoides (strain CBS 100239) TaxID=1163406 RepID=A0A0L0NLA7_TOLOC|nr:hypothetical protein TOPH_00240 [Tolypocladium ophioglossoides CBS 100239]
MLNVPRRLRRRLVVIAVFLSLALSVWYIALPPDSHIRLALGFNSARLFNYLRGAASNRDGWLWKPAQHRLELRSDVGYLIKTGYGTRYRVPEQLAAFAESGDVLGDEGRGFLVVGDWTTANETDAKLLGVEVHDAIKMVMETKMDKKYEEHQRFTKYRSLQGTVSAGDEERARHLGQSYGWELDALKFIMGMEFAYKRMPHKKWYIILDDETYLVKPSLELLLSHLDPTEPHYIGNAVGDYKGRFAHGGSAVLLSGEAMKVLLSRPDVVASAYVGSLDETWGDRLVATTLQKVGIYIDERYCHYFNGEAPEMTRIRKDRACSPIVSFHGLRKPGAMVDVGRALAGVKKPVLWGHLWELFGRQPMEAYAKKPFRPGDHVGPRDEQTKTWKGVGGDDECRKRCEGSGGGWCLAWVYDAAASVCHGSPWMIIGEEKTGDGVVSGINWKKAEPLMHRCLGSL